MEKFALLNLLNALNSLSAKPSAKQSVNDGSAENDFAGANTDNSDLNDLKRAQPNGNAAAQTAAVGNTYPNVMASVLERHEAISNRVKNKK